MLDARQFQQKPVTTLRTDKHILTKLVYEGPAVDGDTAIQALTIETFPWEFHGKVLTEILAAAGLM